MGIPSYYKKLLDTIPGLIRKHHPDADINWLFMDFNCLVYHCLQKMPSYTADIKDEWEHNLLDEVVSYTLKVIREVQPKNGVFIAIDGVVPMAKMRQQRLRRFKSAWLAQNITDETSGGWDKNAITPGTVFMSKLRKHLEKMITKNGKRSWKLSSSDEPGEGEHKIINEWRTGKYTGNFAVYGLDADLIVLSLLGHETCSLDKIWLFREEVTAGKMAYDENGEEIFEWFSINALKDWLTCHCSDDIEKRQFILNYCFAMSILGNDFLPSSLGLKIRDDGHSELLDIIKGLRNNLINITSLGIDSSGLFSLFKILASTEADKICKFISKKKMFAGRLDNVPSLGDNDWPLGHIEEEILLSGYKTLAANWQERYITHLFNGFSYTKNNILHICKEYLYGIQWNWAYYVGRYEEVCFNWYYPFGLPPLWGWLCDYLGASQLPVFPDIVSVKANDIKPVEQLALVLPLESWSLIPGCPEKSFPYLAPQFFPCEFSFDAVGKRFFWECESVIPIPSILEIKEIIRLS